MDEDMTEVEDYNKVYIGEVWPKLLQLSILILRGAACKWLIIKHMPRLHKHPDCPCYVDAHSCIGPRVSPPAVVMHEVAHLTGRPTCYDAVLVCCSSRALCRFSYLPCRDFGNDATLCCFLSGAHHAAVYLLQLA